MKKLLLIILLFSNVSFAQITIRKEIENKKEITDIKYDTNTNKPILKSLVGQYILMLPINENHEDYNNNINYSDCFYFINKVRKIQKDDINNKTFKIINYHDSISDKKHDFLIDKKYGIYFTLLSEINDTIIWHIPYGSNCEKSSICQKYDYYKVKYYLDYYSNLESQNNKDEGNDLNQKLGEKFSLPILIISYFEKLKTNYIGKNFYLYCSINNYIDITTNKEFEIIKDSKVYCKDIILLNNKYNKFIEPYFIMKTKEGHEFAISIDNINENGLDNFISEQVYLKNQEEKISELNKYILKYGKINGNIIYEGKLKIGFTKQMCKDAWGEPLEINKTINKYGTYEQWVYKNSYLYFENGKLTTIQN